MTLTLPRAGTNPGRAPRAEEVPVDTTGQAVAQLGGALMQLAEDRDDRQVKRAQVDLTRDMNDLRLEIEQIGDPDEADAAFTAGVTALRGRYLGDGRNEGGVVPRRRREDFGLTFDSLANAQAFAIGKRNLALRDVQRDQTFADMAEVTRATYMSADDPEMRAAAREQFRVAAEDYGARAGLDAGAIEQLQDQWEDAAEGEIERRSWVDPVDYYAGNEDPDPADDIALRLAADRDAAELARAAGYRPDSAESVARMAERLDAFDAADPDGRRQMLDRIRAETARRRLTELPRPQSLPVGEVSIETLKTAARRARGAHEAGVMDLAAYRREVRRLAALAEALGDG